MKIGLIVFLAMICGTPCVFAETKIRDVIEVNVLGSGGRYLAMLPAPFEASKIVIRQSHDKEVTFLSIHTKGQVVRFSTELLEGLSDLSKPQIVFSKSYFEEFDVVRQFEVLFEYGKPFTVQVLGVAVVDESTTFTTRSIVGFTVDDNLDISRKLWDEDLYRKMYEE